MAYSTPIADFVTTTLSGAITNVATSATIGTGLNIPATNGILLLDYSSTTAVGSDNGPETISYAAYNSGTGAITGLIRGLAYTTNGSAGVGVAHQNGAVITCGPSSIFFQQSPQYDTWNAAGTLTYASVDGPTQTATITGDSTAAIYPGVRLKYQQTQAIQNYWTFDATNADSKGTAVMANIGVPTYTAGKFSNALTLDGASQALSITDAAAFKPTDNFTIGCWFKTSNTGAGKMLFQSYSQNTNRAGINLYVSSTNTLSFESGNNTGSTTYTSMNGSTTVTDGNWHYVVVSFRNNFSQMYLDGKLETSGYMMTPSYAATNYVRIGCQNNSGANITWFNGQIDDLFLAAYAWDEQTVLAKYVSTTAQGTSDVTMQKFALVTASSYSNPSTTVTMFSGTDHTLMNAAISNAYYSTQKAPNGLPIKEAKWSTYWQSTIDQEQGTPTGNTIYNINSISLAVPIGAWKLILSTVGELYRGASTVGVCKYGLSRSASAWTDPLMTACMYHTSNVASIREFMPIYREVMIYHSAKTTWYLLAQSQTADSAVGFPVGSALNSMTDIRAVSTLL